MLTDEQKKYLQTIPEDQKVWVEPWSATTSQIAGEIMQKARQAVPNLEILFMGASALKIPGQNDIDIYMISPAQAFERYMPKLKDIFGRPAKVSSTSIKWEMRVEGYDIELYLTDPSTSQMQQQIRIYELLRDNSELLEEYRQIKESANGLSMREYQRRKYEFYNKILNQ